jgi:hypothetical protein
MYRFKTVLQILAHVPASAKSTAMLARSVVALALAGSAAAFSPMMSMETGRRQVVQAGAAAAVAAPLLRPADADAASDMGFKMGNAAFAKFSRQNGAAPVITIMDHRGCTAHANKEYRGPKSNDEDDEMCVKVAMPVIPISYTRAAQQLQESISYRAKGIDGDYTAQKDLSIYKKPGSSAAY